MFGVMWIKHIANNLDGNDLLTVADHLLGSIVLDPASQKHSPPVDGRHCQEAGCGRIPSLLQRLA